MSQRIQRLVITNVQRSVLTMSTTSKQDASGPATYGSVNYILFRNQHHASRSGYDQLARFGDGIIHARPFSKRIVRRRLMWRIAGGVVSYDWESLATECKAARCMLASSHSIFHVLYGENTYHYLGAINGRRGNRLVATFHQPPAIYQRQVQIDWHMRQLSAVICVGTNQMRVFSQVVGAERVFWVPHGVDTDYFAPDDGTVREDQLCLFVGSLLRDFATLRGVIELVAYLRPEVKFVVLTNPKNYDAIGCHPNLTLQSGISDEELLRLYRRTTLLVMPCSDATANNVILEAMATGLPIVTTDIGGVRDYVDDRCAALVPPKDARCMAEMVIDLLDADADRRRLAVNARKKALEFTWPAVHRQMTAVYESVVFSKQRN